ncbi:MAG: Gfo/Idh/MocA family oxidoreductase [Clostridia bacterium]|nr:Gfo/Idh/MocA family oxidoreductase [Clostridia bacterium]
MDKKIITISILGVGARGGEAYGRYIHESKDRFKVVSLCDPNEVRLKKYGDAFEVEESQRFLDEEGFFAEKRSDVLLIATMDRLHVRQAVRALDLGYDLVLEKPISDDAEELKMLVEKAKANGRMVMVCHVLRYTTMVKKIKSLLDEGAIGRLISMDQTENVCYWHQAHSFVRGNWRNSVQTSPMIMQKCCHDLDLIQYFIGDRCKSVASMGSLAYFKCENKPEGAADRCINCKYKDECKYSAKRIYLDGWKKCGGGDTFPYTIITDVLPLTEEALITALKESVYGRCVYSCDNNVVDNQTVIMQFENGVTATLKMEGFTARGGRDFRFFGTEGELEIFEEADKMVLSRYMEAPVEWKISELVDELGGQGAGGHGGGDHRMFDTLYNIYFNEKFNASSSIEHSVESHYMALAAERSRIQGGKLVELSDYRK